MDGPNVEMGLLLRTCCWLVAARQASWVHLRCARWENSLPSESADCGKNGALDWSPRKPQDSDFCIIVFLLNREIVSEKSEKPDQSGLRWAEKTEGGSKYQEKLGIKQNLECIQQARNITVCQIHCF